MFSFINSSIHNIKPACLLTLLPLYLSSLYLYMSVSQSVSLSVCLSVCLPLRLSRLQFVKVHQLAFASIGALPILLFQIYFVSVNGGCSTSIGLCMSFVRLWLYLSLFLAGSVVTVCLIVFAVFFSA